VASKVTVLVPFLLVVIVAMLGVLRLLNRLPERSLATYASMAVGLLLCAVAALGLGLLTSSSVGNVGAGERSRAMLCFPAVLFAGAILPVHLMARAGAALSVNQPSRWAFEASVTTLGTTNSRALGARSSGLRCLRRSATPGPRPSAPTGSFSPGSRSSSSSPRGVCSFAVRAA